ncbi:unnamed protein product [Adineta ricciae]|uniref:Nuclear receptor domain-containing protein n=1 Tax=Adineta ricciae TaxID=249248 RepID=A0A815LDU9_ADIRI|nr:unnamed protein product [Adineta ricciae]
MTTEKKLIYITSDEQLVHEISLKSSKNTYIIDLDTGEPISATVSKHSSTSDRNNEQSKRSRKSITNSRCVICGDHAIGYNYDVLSCASCKAFFYGHAYENLIKMFDRRASNSERSRYRRRYPRPTPIRNYNYGGPYGYGYSPYAQSYPYNNFYGIGAGAVAPPVFTSHHHHHGHHSGGGGASCGGGGGGASCGGGGGGASCGGGGGGASCGGGGGGASCGGG